jgi:hypothetical protein
MMVGGVVMVAIPIALFLWLIWTTFPDRPSGM